MIDYYGNWTYEPNTSEEKKCDFDRLADEILKQIKESNDQTGENKQIETTIENLVIMIYLHLKDEIDEMKTLNVNEIMELVSETGGLAEFDYYC